MENENKEKQQIHENGVRKLIIGVLLIGGAIGFYYYIGKLEQEGGSMRINWLVALLYEMAGKTGSSAILGGAGILFLGLGARDFLRGSKE